MLQIEKRIGWWEAIKSGSRWCQRVMRRRLVLRSAQRGDFAPLLADAEAALADTLWHCGTDHPETGRKLAALASVHAMRGEAGDAAPLLRRAIGVLEGSREPDDASEAGILREQLAELLRDMGEYRDSEAVYNELIAHYRARSEGSPSAEVARTLDGLAQTHREQNRIGDAKAAHRDALLIWEAVKGGGSPEVARCLTQLATLYLGEQQYDEAEPLLLRAVAAWKASPNPHDLYALITLSCCGDLYRSTGREGEARGAEAAAKAVLARYAK